MPEFEDVLDWVAERARQDPKVQRVLSDVALFDGLKEHVAWRRLWDHVREDKHRFLMGISKRQMAGEEVSSKEIQFHRGFYMGALWILGHPEMAEQNLERVARLAYLLGLQEYTETHEQERSPYA